MKVKSIKPVPTQTKLGELVSNKEDLQLIWALKKIKNELRNQKIEELRKSHAK